MALARRPGERRLRGRVAERPSQAGLVRLGEVELPLGEQRANQRVAVRVQAGRGQADDGVAGPDGRSVDHPRALDDPDRGTRQVEGIGRHQPRVLGGLAADERAARLAAAGRDAAHELGHGGRVELADRHVVQEGERLGAGAGDVVDAHRHEVDPDRVEATDAGGDRGLGADAVGRGDEHRLAIAGRDREGAAEPAEPAEDLGPPGRLDVGPDQVDRTRPGVDVDAGRPVRPARVSHGRPGPPAPRG